MFNAGVYLRLSKEDGDKETSDSIDNQRLLIDNYVDKFNDITIVDYFIDDGYSGLSFDRPAFSRLLREILKGNINTVITKDMSRLGRDRLETGNYVEKVFPINKVRYISILDNYDSLTGSNVDLAPFKGLMDEMYAKDISKKVKGAFDAKRFKGDFIGAFASYGYKKDAQNKNKLIIDEDAAAIVRRIFSMYVSGVSKQTIARLLNEDNIPCPTEYKRSKGINYKNSHKLESTKYWTYSTVSKILCNKLYLGHMVQKKEEVLFKTQGKKISLNEDKWIIVKDTHEPIIDNETYNNAQSISATRTRTMKTENNVTIYAGVMRCADCGRAMSKTICNGKYVYYKCGSYKAMGVKVCSAHSIREDTLNRIVINAIRTEANKAMDSKDMQNLIHLADAQTVSDKSKEIEQLEAKLDKISRYKKKSYEDYADGLLSKDDYLKYKNDYDKEEMSINGLIAKSRENAFDSIEKLKQHKAYVSHFGKHVNIHHLTRELIVELVQSITIYADKKIVIKFKFESPLNGL